MNEKVTRPLNFFKRMRRCWVWGLLLVPLLIGLVLILDNTKEPDGSLHPILLLVTVATSIFEVLWLLSYVMVPYLTHKQKVTPQKQKKSKKKNGSLSSSRMLSRAQQMRAWVNLNELKETCLPCFEGRTSYVRLQWRQPNGTFKEEIQDLTRSNGFSWDHAFCKYGYVEPYSLYVASVKDKEREHVRVWWTPQQATPDEMNTAEMIELVRNEPAIFSYDMTYEREDGVMMSHKEPICIITWIGGNQ